MSVLNLERVGILETLPQGDHIPLVLLLPLGRARRFIDLNRLLSHQALVGLKHSGLRLSQCHLVFLNLHSAHVVRDYNVSYFMQLLEVVVEFLEADTL